MKRPEILLTHCGRPAIGPTKIKAEPDKTSSRKPIHVNALAGFFLSNSIQRPTVRLSGLFAATNRPYTCVTKTMQTAYTAAMGSTLGNSVYTNQKWSPGGGSGGGTYFSNAKYVNQPI